MNGIGESRELEITRLAMGGLMQRQKAIAANTANVATVGYQRKEVVFEDQLRDMIQKEDTKDRIKQANSRAVSFDATNLDQIQKPSPEQMKLLRQNSFNAYKPEVIRDLEGYNPITQNNVDVEHEMMDMAKAGTQYSILANLESKMLKGLSDVIRGGR